MSLSHRVLFLVVVLMLIPTASVLSGEGPQDLAALRQSILKGPYGRMNATELLTLALKTRDPSRHEMRLALLLRKAETLPVLIDRLREAPDEEKYDVLMLIQGELRWREAVPAILELLNDKGAAEHVRGRAATAAALFQQRRALPAIRGLLTSAQETRVRKLAAMALGLLGDAESRPLVAPMLGDPSPHVRVTAAMVLGMLGSGEGEAVALELSRHEAFGVRCRAAEALRYVRSPDAIRRLRDMHANDSSPTVRSESAEHLGAIEIECLSKAVAIQRLKELLAPDNPNPPRWAFVYLVEHFGPDVLPFLRNLAENPGPLKQPAEMALLHLGTGVVQLPYEKRTTP